MRLLARGGVIAEPASATSVAGAMKLMKEGVIPKDEPVVCVITGAGVKWPQILADNVEGIVVDGNDEEAVRKLLIGVI
jgi:threonine synthase